MRLPAWLAVLLPVAAAFAVTLAALPAADWFTFATLALACGVAAFSLMGIAALLGGRIRAVESLFGGLDRVYRAHKWMGVWALALASVHLLFKAGLSGWEMA